MISSNNLLLFYSFNNATYINNNFKSMKRERTFKIIRNKKLYIGFPELGKTLDLVE